MNNYFSESNKKAWDFNTYNYWIEKYGIPESMGENIRANPQKIIKKYIEYFDEISGKSILNVCGSNGIYAIALSLLGADVTIVDQSEQGRKYALKCAESANSKINYNVSDYFCYKTEILYDITFIYIGVIHYFYDIELFFKKIYSMTKSNGTMIYSDFHPFLKIQYGNMNYFDSFPFEAEMPYAKYYDDETRVNCPKCVYREYTLSEIINAIIKSGFKLLCFDERPFKEEKYPCEFIIKAIKEKE